MGRAGPGYWDSIAARTGLTPGQCARNAAKVLRSAPRSLAIVPSEVLDDAAARLERIEDLIMQLVDLFTRPA